MADLESKKQFSGVDRSDYQEVAVRVLMELTTTAAIAFILIFLVLAVQRMFYPFELEWMEGATVDHVARLMGGQQIYTEPSIDWVPFRYAPLYYYVSALAATIFGVGFMPLRLISIISTIGCLTLIYLYVWRETHRHRASLIAAGLYAATFTVSGSWFDLARVDSLFMLILLGAIYIFRKANTKSHYYIAGIMFALAFFTKQSAAFVASIMLLWGLFVNWRLTLRAMAACLATLTVATFVFNIITEGWFGFYVIGMGRMLYPTSGWIRGLLSLLGIQLYEPLSIVLLSTVCYMIASAWHRRSDLLFHIVFLLAMLGTTYVARINQGGWTNTLMPVCAALAVMFGLAIAGAVKYAETTSRSVRQPLLFALQAMVLIQFAFLVYNPWRQLPTAADEKAGNELIQYLGTVDGEVLLVHHGHYGVMAGKGRYMHYQAMRDLFKTDEERHIESLARNVREAIAAGRFEVIITDRDWFSGDLATNYIEARSTFDKPRVFLPVAGWQVRPEGVYVPTVDPGLVPANDTTTDNGS